MQLFISSYGTFIGKKSERLVVKEKGQVVGEYPFHDLEHVIIDSLGVSISADVIHDCMGHGVPISFMTPGGDPYANMLPPNLAGTVATRREQLFAFRDQRGVALAKAFISGKINNQINTVRYFAKSRRRADQDSFGRLMSLVGEMAGAMREVSGITGECIDAVRGTMLSVEGRTGNIYWECIKLLLPDKAAFPGREHRGAQDPVNAMLNYGYAILAHQVGNALTLAGLDVFGGYIHVDRPGKKSLVYDFIEEFRQPVVDRTVVALVNKGVNMVMQDGLLDLDSRRNLAAKIVERLEAAERFQGEKRRLKTIIQTQARHMATFLRGQGKYKPYVCGW